jgi:hypothetical protein
MDLPNALPAFPLPRSSETLTSGHAQGQGGIGGGHRGPTRRTIRAKKNHVLTPDVAKMLHMDAQDDGKAAGPHLS